MVHTNTYDRGQKRDKINYFHVEISKIFHHSIDISIGSKKDSLFSMGDTGVLTLNMFENAEEAKS